MMAVLRIKSFEESLPPSDVTANLLAGIIVPSKRMLAISHHAQMVRFNGGMPKDHQCLR